MGVEKIIEKMKCQPNGIRPEEIDKVLKAYGYEAARQKEVTSSISTEKRAI